MSIRVSCNIVRGVRSSSSSSSRRRMRTRTMTTRRKNAGSSPRVRVHLDFYLTESQEFKVHHVYNLGFKKFETRRVAIFSVSDILRLFLHTNLTLVDEISPRIGEDIHKLVRRSLDSSAGRSEQSTIRIAITIDHVASTPPVQQPEESTEEEATLMEASFPEVRETNGAAPASRSAVESLRKTKVSARNGLGEPCVICMNQFRARVGATVMPCDHMFHSRCLDKWLKQQHSCPLCRFDLPVSDMEVGL